MSTVNIHEAKTRLSQLLAEVAEGKEVVIAKNGQPIARLVPFSPPPRQPGRLKGRIHMSEDFEAPLPQEMLRLFEGKSP